MLCEKSDGILEAGLADIICILRLPTGKYHVAFFEESPMPGKYVPISELEFIRLKSKMHHRQGADSLEESKIQLKDMRKKILISDRNVIDDVSIDVEDPVNVFIVENWIKKEINIKTALTGN